MHGMKWMIRKFLIVYYTLSNCIRTQLHFLWIRLSNSLSEEVECMCAPGIWLTVAYLLLVGVSSMMLSPGFKASRISKAKKTWLTNKTFASNCALYGRTRVYFPHLRVLFVVFVSFPFVSFHLFSDFIASSWCSFGRLARFGLAFSRV